MVSEQKGGSGQQAVQVQTRRRAARWFTAILALLLLATGLAAYQAVGLLRYALRPQTASDAAAEVCTTLSAQRYDLLVQQIDPAPTAEAPGPFNQQAQQRIIEQLRALDVAQGNVTHCLYKPVSQTGTAAQFAFIVERRRAPLPTGMLLTLHHTADSGWRIARVSTFAGP